MSKRPAAGARSPSVKSSGAGRAKSRHSKPVDSAPPAGASSSAVVRAIGLITLFASAREEAGLAQISETQGLSRSVAHKLLQILVDQGLVQYEPARKTYRIGMGLYKLAATVLHDASFVQVARAMMRQLVDLTGESACLNLLDGERAAFTVAAVEESAAPLQYVIEVGQWHPLHAGASGKAILAHQSEQLLSRVLGGARLAAVTPLTQTDAALVRKQIADIRKEGYCISRGERLEGAIGIAAPIIDSSGLAVASVQLTIAAHRFDRTRLAALRQAVVDTARSISAVAQAMPAGRLS